MTPFPETPVAIDRTADGQIDVYALTSNGIESLGRHATPAEAWRAIDAIDIGEVLARAA